MSHGCYVSHLAEIAVLAMFWNLLIRTTAPLHVRHDERTDRAVIAVTDAHMAMVILTGLYLLSVEQVTGRDVKPAGNCLHQLIAGDGETPRMWTPRVRFE